MRVCVRLACITDKRCIKAREVKREIRRREASAQRDSILGIRS